MCVENALCNFADIDRCIFRHDVIEYHFAEISDTRGKRKVEDLAEGNAVHFQEFLIGIAALQFRKRFVELVELIGELQ